MNNEDPEFLDNYRVKELFKVLDGEDTPMLRIVGGAVRNYLLDKPVSDIDMATIWTPDQTIEKCKSAKIKVIPTGVDHGTVTAVIDGQNFEITTLRRDVETDGRRAVVAYSSSWKEDAERRDFTVNALYMDRYGEVFDPLNEGLVDIKSRNVRFIGSAQERIKEDALRILRFYRFSLYYGLNIDAVGALACKDNVNLLNRLSVERVTQELLNICDYKGDVDKFVGIIQLMGDHTIFNMIDSSINNTYLEKSMIRKVFELKKQYELYNKETLLFCLLNSCSHLCLSNRQSKFINSLSNAIEDSSLSVKHLLYKYGRDVAAQSLLFRDNVSEVDIKFSQSFDIPEFPIKGKDLLSMGIEAGPKVGDILLSIEQWWIDQDFKPNRDECLSRVKPT